MNTLPILAIFKESMLAPMRNPIAAVKTFLLIIIALIFISFLLGLLVPFIRHIPIFIVIILVIVTVFGILTLTAYIFNHWIRIGAYGASDAAWQGGGGMKAAFINGIKLLFISILIGVVAIVFGLLLKAVGLASAAPDFTGMSLSDLSEIYKIVLDNTGSAANIITIAMYCAVYSFFSANLTQTALNSDREGIENYYVKDFAIILMLIYAVQIGAVLTGLLVGSFALTALLALVTSLWIMFAVPAAHGIRYNYCVHMQAK